MAHRTADELGDLARDLGLLSQYQLDEVWVSFRSRNIPPEEFMQALVRRELLTNYQVERLLNGERTGFFFGDYRVLYMVGTGTFARVYRAVHRQTGQVVAVKVLRKRFSENAIQASRFVREGQVGCNLRHPNIVPTYEVVSEGHIHFIVMEFIEGWNLREFVRIRKKFEPAEATRMMIGITDGLRYAFEHGLTHRDLKLSNILVSSRGEAKLVDFGLAAMDEALVDDKFTDMSNTRTIDYAALERATGVRKDDVRSDIYFLGCIYYHLLTGQPPLKETRARVQRLSKQRFLEVVPVQKVLRTLPGCVTIVVNRAMMLDPARRYQAPSVMLSDLRIAEKRLAEGATQPEEGAEGETSDRSSQAAAAAAHMPSTGRSVMIIESDAQMQDIFREAFKRAGYRVLIIADPARALGRCIQDPTIADCVVFDAQLLGQSAVDAFNQLGAETETRSIPAVLLLGESQSEWKSQAGTAERRVVLTMPITMKQLQETLARLAPPITKVVHGGK
jgi:eukaryotic-like serine/threonine-protein kinase